MNAWPPPPLPLCPSLSPPPSPPPPLVFSAPSPPPPQLPPPQLQPQQQRRLPSRSSSNSIRSGSSSSRRRVASMMSRLGQRVASVAAGAAIVSLVALLVLLWTVVVVKRLPPPGPSLPPARNATGDGTAAPPFKGHRPLGISRIPVYGDERGYSDTTVRTTDLPTAIHVSEISHPHPLRKDSSTKRLKPCDDTHKDALVEYVTPLKIPALPLHEDDIRYGADDWSTVPNSNWAESSGIDPLYAAVSPVDTGHFRHRQAILWDPHPQYTFCAFGQFFHLLLAEDSSFVSPHLRVTHLWHNYTEREPLFRSEKCFYTGHVYGDAKSSVAVNLCHGMRGHIRTSSYNYLIQPVEPWLQHNKSMTHKVTIVHTRNPDSNGILHCGLEGNATPRTRSDAQREKHRDKRAIRRSSRRKQFSQREYVVEVMVVADKKMAEYYGEDLNDYILTLMSIVARLFKDPSIGNPISIAVVKLMIQREKEFVYQPYGRQDRKHMIGISASLMRSLFCRWQKKMNVDDDSSPDHHDTALLLTRENICRDPSAAQCETLGLAGLGTVCDKNSSCAIVQDNGLSAAFTIAHEFGHVLNMPHDDAEECKAFSDSQGSQNVMSPMLDSATSPWSWSKCSRHYLTDFLEAGHGACLTDPPSKEISTNVSPGKLPGENFTADRQCELAFGPGYRLCPHQQVCKRLWCTDGGERSSCRTKLQPAAEGTSCGNDSWCQRGACVKRDPLALIPMDGGWGSWEKFGECSRTCGGGVRRSSRECNNPRPANGGRYCTGRRMKFQSCNTKDCPREDFREVQCAAFNNNTFGFKGFPQDVKWVPKYGTRPEERCQLYCRVMQFTIYYRLGDKVIDGTPCSPDTFDICVNGICKPAGCDHELGSKSKLDTCGICNGDNSSCHLVKGTFNKTEYGYNKVVRIPIGSMNVNVRQNGYQGGSNDSNYLALVNESGEYVLNGGFVLTPFHKIISLNETKVEYSGINAAIERLNATKPLKQDLIVQILSVGKLYPPDITYEYMIRSQWRYSPWTECTRHCFGISYQVPYCSLLDRNEEIAEHFCSKMPKPEIMERQCNSQCNIRWQLSPSECTGQCGHGYRYLTAHCIADIAENEAQHIDNSICEQLLEIPPEREECKFPCGHWKFGDWGSCSKTCGGGYQHRLVECVGSMGEPVNESLCDAQQRVTTQKCAINSCPSWKLGDWTPCSVTCGTGERHRPYWCNQDNRVVSPQFCNSQLPPPHRESCFGNRSDTFYVCINNVGHTDYKWTT